jgi:DNA-binding transcriptional LysR family regulator
MAYSRPVEALNMANFDEPDAGLHSKELKMKLTVEALMILDAIARRGTFAAAAEELYRVPSTITYAVQKMEEDLGITIFNRSGYRARLTAAGEELLREGRIILQAMANLEQRAKSVAQGYEARFRISVDGLVPCEPLLDLAVQFYDEHGSTELEFSYEVLGGSWEALLAQRADLVIGASGESPGDTDFQTRIIGQLELVAAVSPTHPLASHQGPVPSHVWRSFRAVAIGGSSHLLEPGTMGMFLGQITLTVPTLEAKLSAQRKGLGVGFFPRCFVAPHLQAGHLVEVQLETPRSPETFYVGWNGRCRGRALAWWIERLNDPNLLAKWAGGQHDTTAAP